MLLNEVFQLGNATALQGERRDMENQLHFNVFFTLIQWLQPLKATLQKAVPVSNLFPRHNWKSYTNDVNCIMFCIALDLLARELLNKPKAVSH